MTKKDNFAYLTSYTYFKVLYDKTVKMVVRIVITVKVNLWLSVSKVLSALKGMEIHVTKT